MADTESDETGSVTDADITEIDGIGEGNKDALAEIGFTTVQDIAFANIDGVTDADGFGESRAEQVIESANEIIGGNASTESSTDEGADDEENEAGGSVEQTYTVALAGGEVVYYHTIQAVLREATSSQASNYENSRDIAFRIADELIATEPGDSGGEVELTEAELHKFHEALNNGVEYYRNYRGISGIWAELETLRDNLNEVRRNIIG